MVWDVIKHKNGKAMISVTGDELFGIIPPEVDELIEEYNSEIPAHEGCMHEKIDIEQYFTEKGVYTFNIDPKNITFKEV